MMERREKESESESEIFPEFSIGDSKESHEGIVVSVRVAISAA